MLEQNDYINYNKIEQCLIGILGDCYRQDAFEINKCKNVE